MSASDIQADGREESHMHFDPIDLDNQMLNQSSRTIEHMQSELQDLGGGTEAKITAQMMCNNDLPCFKRTPNQIGELVFLQLQSCLHSPWVSLLLLRALHPPLTPAFVSHLPASSFFVVRSGRLPASSFFVVRSGRLPASSLYVVRSGRLPASSLYVVRSGRLPASSLYVVRSGRLPASSLYVVRSGRLPASSLYVVRSGRLPASSLYGGLGPVGAVLGVNA
ncbi:hypothetical protein NDU88_001185 [Pleurodeles waltl]|uniref:Uncharacterized protein n=1 Tax=Pleurodeles waltl TaxID=8319 RepID=A0AAV7KXU6_PLEWA|nr:hypothetical protein NDU88_001185 [Pleurodeles waltl]